MRPYMSVLFDFFEVHFHYLSKGVNYTIWGNRQYMGLTQRQMDLGSNPAHNSQSWRFGAGRSNLLSPHLSVKAPHGIVWEALSKCVSYYQLFPLSYRAITG